MRNWYTIMAAAVALTGFAGARVTAQETPAVQAPAFDRTAAKAATVELAALLDRRYVFPAIAHAYAARLRAQLSAGAYDGAADAGAYAAKVTADLQAVAPDGHLIMRAPRRAPASGAGAPANGPPIEQPGWIAPGIAYIRFQAFLGGEEAKAFAAFLDAHRGASTLIIDARTHHGGGLDEMNVLFPLLYAAPRTVMMLDMRASVAAEQGGLPFGNLVKVEAPAELYRQEHRIVPGAKTPWRKARVFLLVSGATASAAEHLATVLKYTERGTLIGETTAGAGNYGNGIDLPGGYYAFIPSGHSYFPGHSGWEGTGVAPDIAVAPERALVEALVRSGVPAARAEALSAARVPSEPMTRRRPLRS